MPSIHKIYTIQIQVSVLLNHSLGGICCRCGSRHWRSGGCPHSPKAGADHGCEKQFDGGNISLKSLTFGPSFVWKWTTGFRASGEIRASAIWLSTRGSALDHTNKSNYGSMSFH